VRLLEVHIEVENLEEALSFYAALLPHRKVVRFSDGEAYALILDDGAAFGLWKKGKNGLHGARGADHLHYALQIAPDEYDLYLQRLRNLGINPIEHPWSDGHRSIYFFDRDGHQGEFMTRDWIPSAG